MHIERSAGILLHPSSLPGKFGHGTLGEEAYKFVDFLSEAKQKLWQILPLNPPDPEDNSPYKSFSAFAGNVFLIDPGQLVKYGLISNDQLPDFYLDETEKIDFKLVKQNRKKLFEIIFNNYHEEVRNDQKFQNKFDIFCNSNISWLNDYALYMTLKAKYNNTAWNKWPENILKRDSKEIRNIKIELRKEIIEHKLLQFLFYKQWFKLKEYANGKGIKIYGDLPIYVSFDSADVWSNQELFQLDNEGNPSKIAGVPPDFFSENGQLWGNPLYNWDNLKNTGYNWWLERIKHTLKITDIIRLDHFRGFYNYWAVDYNSENAKSGRWEKGPASDFFQTILQKLNYLPFIAEDLGEEEAGVFWLRDKFYLPGMKVLQFAFDDSSENQHLPHNYSKNNAAYTGTHDNSTTLGWFKKLDTAKKDKILKYLNCSEDEIVKEMVRLAYSSVAKIAITPIQDLFELDDDHRINIPGKNQGNWKFKTKQAQFKQSVIDNLKYLTETYGR